jgi:hypothetical protein
MYVWDGWMDGWFIDRLEELQCYDIIIRGGIRVDSSSSCSAFDDGIWRSHTPGSSRVIVVRSEQY